MYKKKKSKSPSENCDLIMCNHYDRKGFTLFSVAELESVMYILATASTSNNSCKCSLYSALPKSRIDSSFK